MSGDSIAWAGLSTETETAVRALKEQLEKEFRNKIRELEARAEFGDQVKEESGFWSYQKAETLTAFCLTRSFGDLGRKELGRLVEAFNDRFSYALFVRPFCDRSLHGTVELWAVPRSTSISNPNADKVPATDFSNMYNFVLGYTAGVRAIRKTKRDH